MSLSEKWKEKKKPIILGVLVALLVVIALIFFWIDSRRYETTEDAYVGGNQITINPQISGTVTQIFAEDTFPVKKGQLLAMLDPTDCQITLNLKKEQLANTCRSVYDLFEQVKQRQDEVEAKKAAFLKSSLDFQHRKEVLPSGAISLEDYQQSEMRFNQDRSLLSLAKHKLDAAVAQVQNTTILTHPKLKEAIESLKEAYIDLKRCRIVSPTDGVVAQRAVQLGAWVTPATGLMSVIPSSQIWVDANFREVQLKKMRIGQTVTLHADLYGSSVTYRGVIVGIGAGTGSIFSVLPPQNASGNWIKITQRLPVRIHLEPGPLKDYPLRLGLSMEVKVHLEEGEKTGPFQPMTYETNTYEDQDQGLNALVQEILKQNLPCL